MVLIAFVVDSKSVVVIWIAVVEWSFVVDESSVVVDDKTDGIPDDNKSDKEDDIKQEDIKSKVSDSTENKEEPNDKTTHEEKVCKEEVIETCEEDISNENKAVELENEIEDKKDESKCDSDEKESEDKLPLLDEEFKTEFLSNEIKKLKEYILKASAKENIDKTEDEVGIIL